MSIGTPLRSPWTASTSLSPVPITAEVMETASQASASATWVTRVLLTCLHTGLCNLVVGSDVCRRSSLTFVPVP